RTARMNPSSATRLYRIIVSRPATVTLLLRAGIRPSYRAFGAGHSVLASTSLMLTQWPEAAEVSIASHTAWTAAPSRNPGLHGPSGQPSSRSAAWLANEEP